MHDRPISKFVFRDTQTSGHAIYHGCIADHRDKTISYGVLSEIDAFSKRFLSQVNYTTLSLMHDEVITNREEAFKVGGKKNV